MSVAERSKAEPRPPAAGSGLQSGLSNFISQPKSQGAVAVGSSALLGARFRVPQYTCKPIYPKVDCLCRIANTPPRFFEKAAKSRYSQALPAMCSLLLRRECGLLYRGSQPKVA